MLLRKFSRSFERKREGKTAVKFRFDVHVEKVTGAFASTAALRVLWTRGSKVQVTDGVAVRAGAAFFEQTLSQVATLYKDPHNVFETKEYLFKVQMMGADAASKKATLAKGTLDLAQYASIGGTERTVVVPLTTANAQTAKGLELHLRVASVLLKGAHIEDGMSTVSGLSTVTSTSIRSPSGEQDLAGFDGDVYRTSSETIGALTASVSTDLSKSPTRGSEKSSDSAAAYQEGANAAAEMVLYLQTKVEELEGKFKTQSSEKEDLLKMVDSQKRQMESDIAFLKRELQSEREQKMELENQLVKEVDESGGQVDFEEALQSAVAPYELRYNRLAQDYQEVVQQSSTEIDALHEELLAAKDKNAKLESQLEMSERARESLNVEKRALEMSLIGSCTEHVDMDKERKELREELTHVDEVMQELIQTKLKYAELCERQTIARREACKLKEKNLQLASRITKMETYLYYQKSTRA